MKSNVIEECAWALAKDIILTKKPSVDSLKAIIGKQITKALDSYVYEHVTRTERLHRELLVKLTKQKVNSHKWKKINIQLSVTKSNKTAANRALNEFQKKDKARIMQEFIIDNIGEEGWRKCLETIKQRQSNQENVAKNKEPHCV